MTIEWANEFERARALDSARIQEMPMQAFESVVFSQKPATEPWQAVTDYSFEARKLIEGDHPRLIKEVFEPADVLDVGCGPGHLAALLRSEGITHVCGMDIYPETPGNEHWYTQGDIARHDLDVFKRDGGWEGHDLVIFREVNEHLTLRQIRWAVTNLCRLSRRYIYGTSRFSSEHDILRVETSDNLDPTHITLMSKDLLRLLFALEGFRFRQDLANKMDWRGLNRTFVFEWVNA